MSLPVSSKLQRSKRDTVEWPLAKMETPIYILPQGRKGNQDTVDLILLFGEGRGGQLVRIGVLIARVRLLCDSTMK